MPRTQDDGAIGTSTSERLPKTKEVAEEEDEDEDDEEDDESGAGEIIHVKSGGRKGTSAFERDLAAFRELLGEGRRVLKRRAEGTDGSSSKEVVVVPPPDHMRRVMSDAGTEGVLVRHGGARKASAFERDFSAMRDMFSGPTMGAKKKTGDGVSSAAGGGGDSGGSTGGPEMRSRVSAGSEDRDDEIMVGRQTTGRSGSAFERDVAAVRELFSAHKVKVSSGSAAQRQRTGSVGMRPPPPGSARASVTTTSVRRAPAPRHRLSRSSWPVVRDFWAMVDGFRTMFD